MKTEKKKLEALKVVSFVTESLDKSILATLRGGGADDPKPSTDDTLGDVGQSVTIHQKDCIM